MEKIKLESESPREAAEQCDERNRLPLSRQPGLPDAGQK
jgi:hypothetical protein